MAQWLSSRALLQVAQCFVSSKPGHGHGTAHQAMLRQRPHATTRRTHNEEYTTMYRGALGRKIFKKKKKRKNKGIYFKDPRESHRTQGLKGCVEILLGSRRLFMPLLSPLLCVCICLVLGFLILMVDHSCPQHLEALLPFPDPWQLFCLNSKFQRETERQPQWSRPGPINSDGGCHVGQVKAWLWHPGILGQAVGESSPRGGGKELVHQGSKLS